MHSTPVIFPTVTACLLRSLPIIADEFRKFSALKT
jgi:hypothetical protein